MAYVPIRTSILKGDQKIGFDLYLPLASKYIMYLRRGESFEGKRLLRLKDKKVKKMFIREDEEQLYREYMSRNIEMAYDRKSPQSLENRAEIAHGLQQATAEAILEDPESAESYQTAKDNSQRFVQFLLQEDQAIKSLLSVENTDQNLAHHGVTVASLAVEIAKIVGGVESANYSYLALGGLIHDVGHYLSGQNVARRLTEFTPEEMSVYRSHPSTGVAKIKDLKHMDTHVIQIILQHEETINGSGFPSQLHESKLNPLSIFVQSANIYDRLVTFEKLESKEAVKCLFTEHIGKFPLSHLNALRSIVQR